MKHYNNTNIDPWYISGLADGEGTFTFSRSGNHMALYFAIKLNNQDKELLELVQKFFGGIGSIYFVKPFISNSGKTKAACYYRVTRISDLLEIVRHFNNYPLQSIKKQTFQIWREMVIIKKENFKKRHINKLEELAKRLSIISPRNQEWYE